MLIGCWDAIRARNHLINAPTPSFQACFPGLETSTCIIHREVFHQVPPRVEYSATPEGAQLDLALAPLAEWGKKHQQRTEKAKARSGARTAAGGAARG
ncbi:winged helix-turn-helix transcriptional regulator [Bradyrhizobium sp. NP1]|uniref:winged helix-turn-helix transcriptional regulator n=1 Tax=Bradyrhizobium sp. NP1 TaxID=3049772 RepID=UPI0025A5B09C|nr:winged helix-turn-helix transcriptional regulator [Bradyrhizobium sp. NP1]WJR76878.1 winged helix-turn-helix transcriptional regulator [Bradyrhizobium sp. NP1]